MVRIRFILPLCDTDFWLLAQARIVDFSFELDDMLFVLDGKLNLLWTSELEWCTLDLFSLSFLNALDSADDEKSAVRSDLGVADGTAYDFGDNSRPSRPPPGAKSSPYLSAFSILFSSSPKIASIVKDFFLEVILEIFFSGC
ncbi:hypothetical protein X975_16179, partial [Stegodyphus mimosarum]